MLRSADVQSSALFGHDDVARWPAGALEALVEAGLLKQTGYADSVVCDGCEEACIEDVEFVERGEGEPPQAYVLCQQREDMGRLRVPLERLKRWQIDLTALAHTLAAELGATGELEEVVPGRLWRLGRVALNRRQVDVFLGRGAKWTDAQKAYLEAGRLRECSTALVLVPWEVPSLPVFGREAKTLSLARLLSFRERRLSLDRAEVETVVGRGRTKRAQGIVPFPTPEGVAWNQVAIEFVNDNMVKITAGSTVDHKTFADMGFRDQRVTKREIADELWGYFRGLAKLDGELKWEDPMAVDAKKRYKVKKWISSIRAKLQAYFPTILGDPFKSYRRVKAYQTEFILRWTDEYRLSLR